MRQNRERREKILRARGKEKLLLYMEEVIEEHLLDRRIGVHVEEIAQRLADRFYSPLYIRRLDTAKEKLADNERKKCSLDKCRQFVEDHIGGFIETHSIWRAGDIILHRSMLSGDQLRAERAHLDRLKKDIQGKIERGDLLDCEMEGRRLAHALFPIHDGASSSVIAGMVIDALGMVTLHIERAKEIRATVKRWVDEEMDRRAAEFEKRRGEESPAASVPSIEEEASPCSSK